MGICRAIHVGRAGKVGEACLSFVSKLVSLVITLIKFCCLGIELRSSCVFEELVRCVVSMGLRSKTLKWHRCVSSRLCEAGGSAGALRHRHIVMVLKPCQHALRRACIVPVLERVSCCFVVDG